MEAGTSSTKPSLQNGPMSESDVLQLMDICSLSQASDHYNSSIALLLDWNRSSSSDAIADQTSVTSKDLEQICQVESEDRVVRSNGTFQDSNADSFPVAAKSLQSVLKADADQTPKSLALNPEKEQSGSATDDVFCCILGWSAQITGKRLCSCKKDKSAALASNSLSDVDVGSPPTKNSCSKPPEVAPSMPENGKTLPSTSGDSPKRDASTSTLQSTPLVINWSRDVTTQKPKNNDQPYQDPSNIKTEGESEKIAPSQEPSVKKRVVTSPLQEDPPRTNGPKPSIASLQSSEKATKKLPCIDPERIKKESDLEERSICSEPSNASGTNVGGNNGGVASPLQKDPPIALARASETGKKATPCIDPINIKKESDLEEYAIDNVSNTACGINGESTRAGASPSKKDPLNGLVSEEEKKRPPCIDPVNIKKESGLEESVTGTETNVEGGCDTSAAPKCKNPKSGLVHTSEAADKPLPGVGPLNIKKESGPEESETSKEPGVFCCILSWLAQSGGKKVQCSCAGVVKTEPSAMPVAETVVKTEEDSDPVPDTRRRHTRKNGSITKPSLKRHSDSKQTSKSSEQQPAPPPLTWPELFKPQPETSGSCNGGTRAKRKRNSSTSEGDSQSLAIETARQELQNRSLTWLGMLGLQSKMGANSKGGRKGKAPISEEELMGLAQSHMQGLGMLPLNPLSEGQGDAPFVPSKKLKTEILNMIKAKTALANGATDKAKKGKGSAAAGSAAAGNSTKQKGGKPQSGAAAGATQHAKKKAGKAGSSAQSSGKGKLAAGVTKRLGKQSGNLGGSKQKGWKAGKHTAVLGGKSGLKVVSRTGSSASNKNAGKNSTTPKNGKQNAAPYGLTKTGQARKKPGPKKGTKKIVLLEPNSQVVQQTVDLTLNYLSQIFFLEKLF